MHHRLPLNRFAPLLIAALLSACSTPPPTATPEPTAATAAPVATAAPEATAAPVEGSTLPAPLYFLEGGQVYRLEADGLAVQQITFETPPVEGSLAVIEFALSPVDNTLAYVTQRENGNALLLMSPDGSTQTLIDDPDTSVAGLRWMPDGSALAVGISNYAVEPNIASGIYMIDRGGASITPIILNDPLSLPDNPDQATYGYSPLAWAPDGARLLVARYAQQVEQCEGAVVDLSGNVVPFKVPVLRPEERTTTCAGGFWGKDGSLYTGIYRVGSPAGDPGIWKVDPSSGEFSPLYPEQTDGSYNLFAAPQVASDGSILALIAQSSELPPVFSDQTVELSFATTRINPSDGSASPPAPVNLPAGFVGLLWAPDGSGFVAGSISPEKPNQLIWYPIASATPVELAAQPGVDFNGLGWGK